MRDEESGFALDVPAAVVQLSADDGRIALSEPATVRVGDRRTAITTLAGGARFDGRTLHLAGVEVESDEGRVRLDGRVTVIANDPSLDVRLDGAGDVARLARWGMADADAPRGRITFAGRVAGPMAAPAADLDIASPTHHVAADHRLERGGACPRDSRTR